MRDTAPSVRRHRAAKKLGLVYVRGFVDPAHMDHVQAVMTDAEAQIAQVLKGDEE